MRECGESWHGFFIEANVIAYFNFKSNDLVIVKNLRIADKQDLQDMLCFVGIASIHNPYFISSQ